jgi:hypothetical protein
MKFQLAGIFLPLRRQQAPLKYWYLFAKHGAMLQKMEEGTLHHMQCVSCDTRTSPDATVLAPSSHFFLSTVSDKGTLFKMDATILRACKQLM